MRATKILARVAAVAAAILALIGNAQAVEQEVKIATGKQGSYLTDAKGTALYTFKKDTPGKSACTGGCATKWPTFYQETVGVTGDLKPSDFATITREDGKKQTTYKGMPLYYFAEDKAAGDTKGQGVRDIWFLAQP